MPENNCSTDLHSHPFESIRTRTFLFWGLAWFVLLVALSIALEGKGCGPILATSTLPLLLIGWMGWQFYRRGVRVKELCGTLPSRPTPWLWWGAVVVALLIFQVAVMNLRPFFLPKAVLGVLEGGGGGISIYEGGVWGYASQVLLTVFLIPLVEEVFFRGLLLTRWAVKTGSLWWSALASSTAFAVLHFHPISGFVFGLAMVALYARFNSLWLPIAAHVFANGYAFAGGFPYQTVESLIGETSGFTLGAACLLISAPILAWFLCGSKSALLGKAPYLELSDAPDAAVSLTT